MRLFPRFIAFLLVALWLPATEHCALEAAGLVANTCHDLGVGAEPVCTADGCSSLEAAHYRTPAVALQVPAPALHCAPCLIPLLLARLVPARPAVQSTTAWNRPQHWVAAWHFVRRTAPPSRAPTLCA